MSRILRGLIAIAATLLIPCLLWLVIFRLDSLGSVGLVLSLIVGVLLADALLFWFALGGRLAGMDRAGLAFVLPLLIMMLSWSLMRGSVEERIAAAHAVQAPAAAATAGTPAPIVGGDRDAHGCIGSAGYSWCAREHACVRPWELTAQRGLSPDEQAFRLYCGG